eukprot:TRINITY_DN4745_c0_g2_i2.p1 TRINITY_DN4745_c0_g2~~TRINITY_DN4745_c0_g2_i2.p1  ORF type:complete len:179 (+),score=40.17 TRINITY_DN4745_c0_g2_i2:44-580(+)
MSLYVVKAIIVTDNTGEKIVGKYYPSHTGEYPLEEDQKILETKLFQKAKTNGDVVLVGDYVAVFRVSNDVSFFVIGDADENELMLLSVLNTLYLSLDTLLKHSVDKTNILDNFDYLLLVMDELVDRGIILQKFSDEIVPKVSLSKNDTELTIETIADQSVSGVLENVKEKFISSFFYK